MPLKTHINISDRNVFRGLVEQYYTSLLLFAGRIMGNPEAATDVVQEAFAGLWERRGKVRDAEYARNYLYMVVRNHSVDYCRRTKKHEGLLPHVPDAEDISLNIIRSEITRLLDEAIGSLPPRGAQVIRMTLDGIRQEEIARVMQIQVRTVKALKADSIKKLRKILGPVAYAFVVSLFFGNM